MSPTIIQSRLNWFIKLKDMSTKYLHISVAVVLCSLLSLAGCHKPTPEERAEAPDG